MTTVKVFRSGGGQAVQLPKKFRFRGKEVAIFRRGDEVVLLEKSKVMARTFELIANLPIDIDALEARDEPPQEREGP